MSAVSALRELMARLRDPNTGCPWDLAQSFGSIAPYTIEEAYEVADAIERGDLPGLREELGDLLLQVVFHARMAEEQGSFDLEAVAAGIVEKMTRRHPHIFGDQPMPQDAATVALNWEAQKRRERPPQESILDGVSLGLPGIQRADELQRRAAKQGFDWPDPHAVLDKLDEERNELAEALATGELDAAQDELADVLFVAVRMARHLETDAETLLRRACHKFERRFRHVETAAKAEGMKLSDAPLEVMEAWWQEGKRSGL